MIQNAQEQNAALSQEELVAAEVAEKLPFLQAQVGYLFRRVMVLRAENTRLQARVAELERELSHPHEPGSD